MLHIRHHYSALTKEAFNFKNNFMTPNQKTFIMVAAVGAIGYVAYRYMFMKPTVPAATTTGGTISADGQPEPAIWNRFAGNNSAGSQKWSNDAIMSL
jgi:hypothetical protein